MYALLTGYPVLEVEVEWDFVMELVRGLWSIYMISFRPSIKCGNFLTVDTATARCSWLNVEYRDSGRWVGG